MRLLLKFACCPCRWRTELPTSKLLPEFQVRKEEARTSNLNGLLTTGCLQGDLECGHLHTNDHLSLIIPLSAQDGGYPFRGRFVSAALAPLAPSNGLYVL